MQHCDNEHIDDAQSIRQQRDADLFKCERFRFDELARIYTEWVDEYYDEIIKMKHTLSSQEFKQYVDKHTTQRNDRCVGFIESLKVNAFFDACKQIYDKYCSDDDNDDINDADNSDDNNSDNDNEK